MEKELEMEGGRLSYEIRDEGIAITACRVEKSRVELPDTIEGIPVFRIERKAFLSRKQLKEICLPGELQEIGDWAFAYCSNLTGVWFPRRNLRMGKSIFKECGALKGIWHLHEDSAREYQSGMLLGAVPVKMETEYLFTPKEAGSQEWIMRFDARLKWFLEQPDEDGYLNMVYCGEEDIMSNLDLYLAERRRAKSRLCFLRLMNPVELPEEFREELQGYLREHTKGCESEAAWEVVFREHGNEQDYYTAFTDAGCVSEENYDALLSQMGEQYPEMKGYLMRYKAQEMESVDFFDALSLD